jgi:hypothetical protein
MHGTPMGAEFGWNTCFPQEGLSGILQVIKFSGLESGILRLGAVSRAARDRANAYQIEQAEKVSIADQGIVSLRRSDDLGAVPGAPGNMTTTAAFKLRIDLQVKGSGNLEMVAMGVIK